MSRAARLIWARGILSDTEGQSDARLRCACLTILNHSPASNEDERLRASEMLASLQPQTNPNPKQKVSNR